MSALDDLVAQGPPSGRRPKPDDETMAKILAARSLGYSYRRIADALSKDGPVTHYSMVSRWVREHDEA